jgi:hypothetical protein
MSRSISGPTLSAIAGQMTRPGYLVEILWPSNNTIRFSSRGDTNWNSLVWPGYGSDVGDLSWDGSGDMRGTITLLNGGTQTSGGGAFTSLALTYGFADIPVKIWIYDKSALAAGDPVLVVDGRGDSCQVAPDRVRFNFTSKGSRVQFSPRQYITAEQGFSIIPPDGKILYWGGQKYVLRRAR